MHVIRQELALMFGDQSKRLNIIRYFSYQVFTWLILLVLGLTYSIISFKTGTSLILNASILVVIGIMMLVLMVFNILWFIRRLNDANLSGIWILLPLAIGIVALLYGKIYGPQGDEVMTVIISVAQLLGIIMQFIPGSKSVNRFGAVPQANNFFNYTFFIIFILSILLFAFVDTFHLFSPAGERLHQQVLHQPRIR